MKKSERGVETGYSRNISTIDECQPIAVIAIMKQSTLLVRFNLVENSHEVIRRIIYSDLSSSHKRGLELISHSSDLAGFAHCLGHSLLHGWINVVEWILHRVCSLGKPELHIHSANALNAPENPIDRCRGHNHMVDVLQRPRNPAGVTAQSWGDGFPIRHNPRRMSACWISITPTATS